MKLFFGAPSSGGKRGRGTDKTPVLVSISLTDEGKPQYAKIAKIAKMEVVEAVNCEVVSEFAKDNITKGSEVRTDGLSVYKTLAKDYNLNQKVFDPKNQPEHLHWIHIIISNAKALIDGTLR